MLDLVRIIEALERLHRPREIKIGMSNDEISQLALYNKALEDIIETLKGIENGNIVLEKE